MNLPTVVQQVKTPGAVAAKRGSAAGRPAAAGKTSTSFGTASLSVVVPTRRYDAALAARLGRLAASHAVDEIIVVEPDGAGTAAPALRTGPHSSARPGVPLRLLRAPRGRGSQCDAGGRVARGALLMFLHDDTRLPADALPQLRRAFADPTVGAACFRLRFDREHWLLRLYGACSRFETVLTTFGDQGLVVRRGLYQALGGFPHWPLFEDVELARRLRRRSRMVKLPAAVTTSAVRFTDNGILRQQLFNASLLMRFLLGADPRALAACYERRRR